MSMNCIYRARSLPTEPLPLPELLEGWVVEYLVPWHHVSLNHLLALSFCSRLHHCRLSSELLCGLHNLFVLFPRNDKIGSVLLVILERSILGHFLFLFVVIVVVITVISMIMVFNLLLYCVAFCVSIILVREEGRLIKRRSVGHFRVF